jgi:hypothetical protein
MQGFYVMHAVFNKKMSKIKYINIGLVTLSL